MAAMRAAGEITEIEVEGSRVSWLALTRDLPALARAARRPEASRGTTLLSPFDSLLWYRERVARLFGFDYRIQVYTPSAKRLHGYYTLPIVHDGHLIGRADAKAYRAERRLEVLSVHFEPWFAAGQPAPSGLGVVDADAATAGFAAALASLATFVVGGGEVTLSRVTPQRLRTPLSRALSAGRA